MAQTQLDVESANRFINSLSKSLQALCHGCMDFDAGIEIVGYININIDSGSKVDYVLNEKVLKSTTNSMTFVSNSFLAQKEKTKNCKDGSCSPIPELNQIHRGRGGYSYPATQLYRSSGIYSPHSQVLRGSQKRAWSGGDWRNSPRKFQRGEKSQYGSHQQSSSQNESYSSYSNQMSADSNLPISSQQSSYTSQPQQEYDDSGQQSDVNIKTEVEENTEDSSKHQNSAGGDSSNLGELSDNVNIKADPDSLTNQEGYSENTTKTETDSFLQPNKIGSETHEGEATTQAESKDDSVTQGEDSSYNAAIEGSSGTGDASADNTNEYSQGPSGADADYDGSGEYYPQSAYSGEGSSGDGGGQFEVIEIDDEDEDVAAMFNDPNSLPSTSVNAYHSETISTASTQRSFLLSHQAPLSRSFRKDGSFCCHICNMKLFSKTSYSKHLMDFHPEQMKNLPYNCEECGKSFFSAIGLKYHKEIHTGESLCTICHQSFKYSRNLKRHMEYTHGLKECRYCKNIMPLIDLQSHKCDS